LLNTLIIKYNNTIDLFLSQQKGGENMLSLGWIVLGGIIIVLFWLWGIYNGLVTLKLRAEEAWADINTQLKRRYDLIPNLVETVKGYARHEKEVFERVTKARAQAMQSTLAGDLGDIAKSENMLASALKSILVVAEAYPDLKVSQNFLQLQDELSDTENKIQAARRFFNGNVRDYNIKINLFPSNFVARMFNFSEKKFFELGEAAEREPVKVRF
jgi:LemA protein